MVFVQLIVLLGMFVLLRAFILDKYRLLQWAISIFLAILFAIQLSSAILTGDVADYRFYQNFDLEDVLSVAEFFGKEGIFIFFGLLVATMIIFFGGSYLRSLRFRKFLFLGLLVLGTIVLSLPGGIFYHAFNTIDLKLAGDTSFDQALADLEIDPDSYVQKSALKAEPGKNIIVLSLESLEKGYFNLNGGQLTPNLNRLAERYTLYTMDQVPAGAWTSASMYIALSGVPAYFSTHGNSVFQKSFENKLTTMPDVLQKAGYDLQYFIGKKEFSGIEDLLTTHNFTVKSEKDFQDKYQKVDWGIQDMDLFEEFKKELQRKKGSPKPFALFLSTIGTHFPNGVPDKRVDSLLPAQKTRLELMVSATDYFVGNLIDFLETEGMLSNTVFYLYPDHLLMGNRSQVIDEFEQRALYILTNAQPKEIGRASDERIFQIDIPKIIVDGAGIEHNAQFLTDFIPDSDKNAFLHKNGKKLLRLNDAALKTLNCKDGIYLALIPDSDNFEIKNSDDKRLLSIELPKKGRCTRILFDTNLRPFDQVIIEPNQLLQEPKAFAYVDVFMTGGRLYGSFKGKYRLGITKSGDHEVVFDSDDLDLLGEIKLLEDRQNFITLESHSWNAKKPSHFTVMGKQHFITRGITLIVFNTRTGYEFRTYDTYADQEATQRLVETLTKLQVDGAKFALLAHDAASRQIQTYSEELKSLGFEKLGTLPGRHAYIGHNLGSGFTELTDGKSVIIEPQYPKTVKNDKRYLSEPTIAFETKVDRYIAHAAGAIDGLMYTNSLEAMNANYERGFRLFELDISETSDGHFVATHDWNHWKKETGYTGDIPVSLSEFKKHKIRKRYRAPDIDDINEWFASHPDAILVTDKINRPKEFADRFVDKERLIMELFSLEAVKEALQHEIAPLVSEKVLNEIKGDAVSYLIKNDIKYIGLSRRSIAKRKEFLKKCRENDIKVYVYQVNFDAGKDEKYVFENELGIVYGMYADYWLPIFEPTN